MGSKVLKATVGVALGLVLGASLFASGAVFGALASEWQARVTPALEPLLPPVASSQGQPPTPQNELTELFEPFWEAWDIVHMEFVDQPLDDLQLMRGSIRGMLDALGDPNTAYMDPDQHTQANIPLDGEYEGIGAWVDAEAEFLTIVSPMPNSPAEEAGLQPGDEIIAIDGEDMSGIDPSLVIRRVLGPEGTRVVLTIRREGLAEPFDVEVMRALITVPSVESEILEGNIAYVRLFTFGIDTVSDLESSLREVTEQEPVGLILDLRGNGGGYLATAVDVASQFISDNVIIVERFGDGSEETFEARRGGLATDIPMVVLVNGGSASASEIVAGAMQDLGRAIVVGETTFGKGSVQNWHSLESDGGAVRVTIARWYTPLGRSMDETGLTPDIEVELTEEDIENDLDPQLDAAVEYLLENLP